MRNYNYIIKRLRKDLDDDNDRERMMFITWMFWGKLLNKFSDKEWVSLFHNFLSHKEIDIITTFVKENNNKLSIKYPENNISNLLKSLDNKKQFDII